MRGRFLVVALFGVLGLVGVLGVVSGSSATTPVWPFWGGAVEVPGTAALNSGDASVGSVSCSAAGECAAGGGYGDGAGHLQAFVVSETNSVWGDAVEVPGTAALNSGGFASVTSVSCGAAGECAAGGFYAEGSGQTHAFVVSETNGVWGDAVEVPGTAALNNGGPATVNAVSCVAAGECEAGGYYGDGPGHSQAFVVSETNGVWADAVEVPGSAALNSGGDARVDSVSCVAAGDCAAGGSYDEGSGPEQAFVVSETNGVWGDAVEVPGTAALNSGGSASVYTVSCGAAGDCAAGGSYWDGSLHTHTFVVSATNGVWGDAVEVPGTAPPASGGNAYVFSVSCTSAGDCVAGGYYTDGRDSQAFVVSETNGVWGNAVKVPGTAALNSGGSASVNSVSCVAAGDCAAGGYYADGQHVQAFVVSETNGVWGNAVKVPGAATLNKGGYASVNSVSCAAAGACAAGGSYRDGSHDSQAFVVTSAPDATPPCVVPNVVRKTLRAAKKTLTASHCGVGKIKKVYSRVKKGRVVAEHAKLGQQLKHGNKVALTLSKGKK